MTEAFGLSDIGPVRENNEDCLACDLTLNLFVVADGMGGQSAGEVASRIALEAIVEFVQQSDDGDDFTWPFGLDPTLSDGANRLKTALLLANERIRTFAETSDAYFGMGTTAVCALLSGRQLTIAHVGDSRLYLFSKGTLTQMTEDDSWSPSASANRADRHGDEPSLTTRRNRHVLTNALGAQPHTDVHVCERELVGDELLLLCSDGLHGAVEDETLRDLLGRNDDLEGLGHALISTALERGTLDNVTAVLVRYSPDS
jgi:protein phosphatase